MVFTPDLPVCELVFRAWPNKPVTARAGNRLKVEAVTVGGEPSSFNVTASGAPPGAPGTLVEVPLASCVPAGTPVEATLAFTLGLAEGTDERVGMAAEEQVAWFGSAFPLLAWEAGRGWAREDAVDVAGEMATSEDFALRSLEVRAPPGMEVLATGAAHGQVPADTDVVHRFAAPAVRDVSVTVGRLDVVHRDVDGVRVHVGAPAGATARPEAWAEQVEASLARLTALLGPLPYADLWVSVLPGTAEGVEFPGAVQMGDTDPQEDAWLVTHELAHMWFYGLVGNNQARDPWLDESLASFVQQVVDDPGGDPDPGEPGRLATEVGRPMEQLDGFRPALLGVCAGGVRGGRRRPAAGAPPRRGGAVRRRPA